MTICRRALGPLYRHSALISTFDFSGLHSSTVHPAKQLLVVVWCLKEVRLGVANRDSPHSTSLLLPRSENCRAVALNAGSCTFTLVTRRRRVFATMGKFDGTWATSTWPLLKNSTQKRLLLDYGCSELASLGYGMGMVCQ